MAIAHLLRQRAVLLRAEGALDERGDPARLWRVVAQGIPCACEGSDTRQRAETDGAVVTRRMRVFFDPASFASGGYADETAPRAGDRLVVEGGQWAVSGTVTQKGACASVLIADATGVT